MVDATNNNLISNVDLYYTVNNGERIHIAPPNDGNICLPPLPYGGLVSIQVSKSDYSDGKISEYVTEDKYWTIALPPMVKR